MIIFENQTISEYVFLYILKNLLDSRSFYFLTSNNILNHLLYRNDLSNVEGSQLKTISKDQPSSYMQGSKRIMHPFQKYEFCHLTRMYY